MAVVPKRNKSDDIGDITNNLPSLQFESALTDDEKQLLVLRKRSHAQNATAISQATYFVSILNEARQIHGQLRHPEGKKASRLLQELAPKDPLIVGIIGCGRLGSQLANCILTYGEVNPDDLKISTRRPETLTELQEKGVPCFYNNVRVASLCHLVFLCVLPSQLQLVADEICEDLPPHCLVYSFLAAVSLLRHKQLLDHSNIIQPEFKWNVDERPGPWDNTLDLSSIFSNSNIIQQTCPLAINKRELVVYVDDKFAELMVYAFVNMCTYLTLTRTETVDVVNAIILGENSDTPLTERIEELDIARKWSPDSNQYPIIDLTTVIGRDTPLTLKLVRNDIVRKQYIDRYVNVFQQYIAWKNLALQKAKRF